MNLLQEDISTFILLDENYVYVESNKWKDDALD